MKQVVTSSFKLGILGGGQLGKMLCAVTNPWDVQTYILDPTPGCPASTVCTKHIEGSFKDYDTVLEFGRQVDVVTLEIEHVNVEALRQLKSEGIEVYPDPEALAIIQDKGLQKQFYANHEIPTADFDLYTSKEEVLQAVADGKVNYPFVQKSRTAGYDGKGVAIIKSAADNELLLEGGCVIEDLAPIHKEIAVIASRNTKGEVKCFPAVEMEFNPDANLVEWLLCPAFIDEAVEAKAAELATAIIEKMDVVGLLAVEMFLDAEGNLLINEVAPRPHNSGHHTIEALVTSQYEQHLRSVFGFPLGSTEIMKPAVMINLLGEPGFEGPTKYEGLEESMGLAGVNVHIYGKKTTKPFRKMGHVTVVGSSVDDARNTAREVKQLLKVKAWEHQKSV